MTAPHPHERRRPNQDRAVQKRQQILDGAKKLLSEREFNSFNMREVAKVSGVGLGTIYDYFPKKSSILYWLLNERMEERLEILRQYVDALIGGDSFDDTVRAYDRDMRAANMWSRLDITLLFSADYDDESLIALKQDYQDRLADIYCYAYREVGSDWPDKDLRSVARYLIHLDLFNIQLQLDAPPNQRFHYRNMTYEAFKAARKMTMQPLPADRALLPTTQQ